MSTLQGAAPAGALFRSVSLLSLCRRCLRNTRRNASNLARPQSNPAARRSASTTTGKPSVLERPDAYRPPSHPSQLNRTRGLPAGYNQGTTREEKQRQQQRTYPHMFPNDGTFMHWFLTNRKIHLWITMGTLTILATITATQSFIRTSPYSHLLPSLSSFPLHPIQFISETLSVLRLHTDYETARTNESRQQKILDAQKRRLWRRAHGLENLDAAEEQGIDVRGLVPWDDGLTNQERAAGGRNVVLTGEDMTKLGMLPGDDQAEFAKKLEAQGDLLKQVKERGVDAVVKAQAEAARRATRGLPPLEGEEEASTLQQDQVQPQEQRRKRKLYFGIW